MAVYGLEKGELVVLAETLEEMLCPELAAWEVYDDLMGALGLGQWDEVEGAYTLYRRARFEQDWPQGKLPGCKFLFQVEVDGENIDYILIGDRLPDYLAVLRVLQPLVDAARDLAQRSEQMRLDEQRRLGRD